MLVNNGTYKMMVVEAEQCELKGGILVRRLADIVDDKPSHSSLDECQNEGCPVYFTVQLNSRATIYKDNDQSPQDCGYEVTIGVAGQPAD